MITRIFDILGAALCAAFLFIAAGTGAFLITGGGTAHSVVIGWGLMLIVWFMVTLLFIIMKDYAK